MVVLAGSLLLIVVFVLASEVTHGVGPLSHRFRDVLRLVGPFSVGVVLPLAAFGLFYWQAGALDDLVRGLFILPQARLDEGSMRLPALASVGLAVPYAAFLIARRRRSIQHEAQWAIALAVVLAVVLALGQYPVTYRSVWAIARSMPLVAALAGLWMIQRWSGNEPLPARVRELMFLLATVAAAVSLVQFPYASPTYFFYVAPLVALAMLALVSLAPSTPRRLHAAVALFFAAFALLYTNRSYGWNLGAQFIPYNPQSPLSIERGGLLVPENDKREYEALVALVQRHAAGGTIYAGPDCPEVYFLSGFSNPTRNFFEFLSPEVEDARWMEDLLRRAPIRAVVINREPLFSPPLDPRVMSLFETHFPKAEQVGRFTVRFGSTSLP
jgi:hypothetical protein